jgi:hypothetical protein
MKKLIYIIALFLVLGAVTTSCTDENIKPTTSQDGGGHAPDPKN